MEAGSLRAQLTHDNDAKEEEISTLRDTLNKRINSLQDQLEEEYTTSKTALKVSTITVNCSVFLFYSIVFLGHFEDFI